MEIITVRQILESEWDLYKTLRLSSLKESPDAFGSTFERECLFSDDQWRSKLKQNTSNLPLVAFSGSIAIGLAWGRINEDQIGTVNIFQMWVSPNSRTKGAGKKLLFAIHSWAVSKGQKCLVLHVAICNSRAVALYECAGFRAFGETEFLRPGSSVELQSMKMNLS